MQLNYTDLFPQDYMRPSANLKESTLPQDLPEHVVTCSSFNRWGTKKAPGALVQMIHSVQKSLSHDKISENAVMLIADNVIPLNGQSKNDIREAGLDEATRNVASPTRIFVMTPETQEIVARILMEKTGIKQSVIRAITTDFGYASHRQKLDVVQAGIVRASKRSIRSLTLDDDTTVPEFFPTVTREYLDRKGFTEKPNSQLLLADSEMQEENLSWKTNSIRTFFQYLGEHHRTLEKGKGHIPLSYWQKDTMNEAVQYATTDSVHQFEVTHDPDSTLNHNANARIVAAVANKCGIPDYRTVRIAHWNFSNDLPEEEMPLRTVLSGPPELFTFQRSRTNVDSAALARWMDEQTSMLPWWFVSSLEISKRNPLSTVTGPYRADNELLPIIMDTFSKSAGEMWGYISGLAVQVHHHRARSGHRPGLEEQSTASLVGNLPATRAAMRLSIDRLTNRAALERPDSPDSIVPTELATSVFEQLLSLAEICKTKLDTIEERSHKDPRINRRQEFLTQQYHSIYESLRKKLANFDFKTFQKHLNQEVYDQLHFFADVLDAYPAVVHEVQLLIESGRFPVYEYSYDQV